MGDFIVSARKYRPSTFKSMVGQESITTTLKNAVNQNQVAQAFLFCGPRGVGKTTCARILAKTINCQNRTADGEACNECDSCLSFNQSTSFNIFELDAASNNSVDDIRSLVDQVRIPPQGARYKVYIIDEVHMLTSSAFNAFLKTLEEPPAYAKFILATTEKHKILPTILSRCQIFDFKRIKNEDIANHLAYVAEQEGVKYEKEGLQVIAQKADGGLRDALSIFDQIVSFSAGNVTYSNVIENLNVLDYEYFISIADALFDGNVPDALLMYNDILEKGFDGQHFLDGFSEHLRDLIVCKSPEMIKLLDLSENIKAKYFKQVERMDGAFLLQCLDLMSRCSATYKTSNNKRLHVELSLMLACKLKGNASLLSSSGGGSIAQANPQRQSSTYQPKPAEQKSAESKPEETKPVEIKSEEPKTAESNLEEIKPDESKIVDLDVVETPKLVQEEKTELKPTPVSPPATAQEKSKQMSSAYSSPLIEMGTTSLKDLLNEKKTKEIIKDNPHAETDEINETEFAETTIEAKETVLQNWKSYVEQATPASLVARSLLVSQIPQIEDNHFFLEVTNTVSEQTLKEVVPTLSEVIYSKTGKRYAFAIKISSNIKVEKRIIDPDEKFRRMIEVNPCLLKMKQELNLGIY